MMIRWNWGTGITIFVVLFMAACIFFLFYSRGIKSSMVEDDYYAKELKHEEKLTKMRNVNDLKGEFTIQVKKEEVLISFPYDFKGNDLKGDVHVYRPSDESLDFTLNLKLDSLLMMHIPGSKLRHGKYVLKADWTAMGKTFYIEKDIFVP